MSELSDYARKVSVGRASPRNVDSVSDTLPYRDNGTEKRGGGACELSSETPIRTHYSSNDVIHIRQRVVRNSDEK